MSMNLHVHIHHDYPQVEDRLRRVEAKLDLLMEKLMATKEEIQADLATARQEALETRGEANAAIAYIGTLLERISQSAASATDLDGFRTELAAIIQENNDTQAALKGAIQATPPTTPA